MALLQKFKQCGRCGLFKKDMSAVLPLFCDDCEATVRNVINRDDMIKIYAEGAGPVIHPCRNSVNCRCSND